MSIKWEISRRYTENNYVPSCNSQEWSQNKSQVCCPRYHDAEKVKKVWNERQAYIIQETQLLWANLQPIDINKRRDRGNESTKAPEDSY